MNIRCWAGIAGLAASLIPFSVVSALEVEISAGDSHYPAGSLVSFLAPAGLHPTHRAVVLVSDDGQRVIAQRDASSTSLLFWLLEDSLEAGTTRRYEVTDEVADETNMLMVDCRSRDDDYELSIQGKPVMLYNAGLKPCPVEGFKACKRSGFIHPVYAPDGAVVSDDFPPEHPHQHGIMFAWVESEFQGKPVDFWNSMEKQGVIEHVEVQGSFKGPVYAELDVLLRHSQLLSEDIKQPVLDERWRIHVYNSTDPYVFDIQSTITCATDKPLHLKEYHYGGMAYRGARGWSFGKAEFLTSGGQDREKGNHTRPLWTAITGDVNDKPYTICGVEFPSNYRFPQPVRLHPDMPYFCWSPPVLGEFDITPERPYVSKYRFVVLNGKPDATQLDAIQAATQAPLMAKRVD